MLKQVSVQLYFEDGRRNSIRPYLRDAAFPLGQHMLKVHKPPPAAGLAEARCNRRLLIAPQALSRHLEGWRVSVFFAQRACSGINPNAIQAYSDLHSFLEERAVDMPEVNDVDNEILLMTPELADSAGGIEVGAMLTERIEKHWMHNR
jgi:hypothetical protein